MWTTVDLVSAAQEQPEAVAHLGLRTTSPLVQDALALAATDGKLDAAAIRTAAELGATLDRAVRRPAPLAALALLWSGLGAAEPGQLGARTYAWLTRADRLPDLPLHHQAAAQSLYLAGEVPDLVSLLPRLHRIPRSVRHDLEVDLAHPGLLTSSDASTSASSQAEARQSAHARWVELLSARFVEHDLAPLTVADDGTQRHLFDQLGSPAPAGSTGGPLVTVIVPCWRPDEGLVTSVRSLTQQTYADLDIIVVDDASGPGYEELFEDVTRADPRTRLLRLRDNGGSYLARRAALEIARGELVTTQDADDWSHPQRVERQVALLLEHPQAPASRSLAIRARDDLTHQWFGYRAVRDNASSLMVRREVMAQAGTFWPIRKSADSEYAERLVSMVGPVLDTGTPLAVTRLRQGSLSRGDFTYQWSHPDRIAFRGIYRSWHRRLHRDPGASVHGEPPQAVADANLPGVPAAFARGLTGTHVIPPTLDVVLLGDFSQDPAEPRSRAAVLLLEQALGRGAQVGLWHVETPTVPALKRPEMHDAWFDRIVGDARLHVCTRTQACSVGLVVVLDPSALLTAVAQPTVVRTARVEVAVAAEHTRPGPSGLPVDLLGVSDACLQWWGRRPDWVVLEEGHGAATVREDLPQLSLGRSVVEEIRW